jgi:dihydropteroate synthase
VDTVHAQVAEAALDAGAVIVNDVSFAASSELLRVVARRSADYVLMHTRGKGEVTAPNTDYIDVVTEVRAEMLARVRHVESHGIERRRIWLDPGLGFAKTSHQSLLLLAHLGRLCDTGLRVLAGPSRKGFIAESAPAPDGLPPPPAEREGGTAAAVAAAVLAGARAVRVHDVALMRQAVRVAQALRAAGGRA